MSNNASSIIRIAALAALVGSLSFVGPVIAAPADAPAPSQAVRQSAGMKHGEGMDRSPEAMARHVEDRIETLHDKLKITSAQEAKWGEVAQVMRDNEADLSRLIQERHQNDEGRTAVDDLQSYARITQAHADGIKKMIPAFEALYNDMPDAQKKNADEVFGSYEGHGGKARARRK